MASSAAQTATLVLYYIVLALLSIVAFVGVPSFVVTLAGLLIALVSVSAVVTLLPALLSIRLSLLAVKRTSYIIKQDVRKVGSDVIVAEASIVFVAINQQGQPVPVPDTWRDE